LAGDELQENLFRAVEVHRLGVPPGGAIDDIRAWATMG
jgi:hypothetical protein